MVSATDAPTSRHRRHGLKSTFLRRPGVIWPVDRPKALRRRSCTSSCKKRHAQRRAVVLQRESIVQPPVPILSQASCPQPSLIAVLSHHCDAISPPPLRHQPMSSISHPATRSSPASHCHPRTCGIHKFAARRPTPQGAIPASGRPSRGTAQKLPNSSQALIA